MPRKKADPSASLVPQPFDLMEAFDGMAEELGIDSGDAMLAAMDFEKNLLSIAQTIAAQAIRVGEPDKEAARIEAAGRQVDLMAKLYRQLQALVQESDR